MSSQYYAGIDLGTANCCLSYTEGDGKVKSLKIGDDTTLPSVVTFTEKGIYVGHEALNLGDEQGSWNTASHFKRVMGENIVRVYNGVEYDPTELSALLLKKLRMEFEKQTGSEINEAVITIPSDYGDVERHSTYNAAMIAGFKDVTLLSESLAAAVSYGMSKKSSEKKLMIVYDLGSGTLDVCVVEVCGGKFRVLADESNKDLGGRDWDLQLATLIQKKILDTRGMEGSDVMSDSDFRRNLLKEAERIKIELERRARAVGEVTLRGESTKFSITREEFEESTRWLMDKSIDMLGYALRDSKHTMSEVSEIVLVGASSLMLQVPRNFREAFPSKDIIMYRPEYAISDGAALYAESKYGNGSIEVIPVMTKTYGILAGIDGVEKICNVVFKNTNIPSEYTLTCRPKRDDQDFLDITIYESMSKFGEDFIDISEGKQVLKESIPLTGKISRGRTKIPIVIKANKHGKMSFDISCNGNNTVLTFLKEVDMTPEELQASAVKMEGII
jgi:molecular chaperone DnaK (HSP70)